MNRLTFLFLLMIIISGCFQRSSTTDLPQGKILITTEYPSYSDSTYVHLVGNIRIPKRKWYWGDLVIEQNVTYHTEVRDGVSKDTLLTNGFIFQNFVTRTAAEYSVFSDAAKPLQTFSLDDTVQLIKGGRHKGVKYGTSHLPQNISLLPDTTYGGIRYKRILRAWDATPENSRRSVQVYYLRPDVSEDFGRLYFWADSTTRSLKAPIVCAEIKPSLTSPIVLGKAMLDILADTLTPAEEKVFIAWQKNERIQ